MRGQLGWVERLEDGVKLEVRVTFEGARRLRWQSRRSDEEKWVYDFTPTAEQWDGLLAKMEARYRRRASSFKELELVRALRPKG